MPSKKKARGRARKAAKEAKAAEEEAKTVVVKNQDGSLEAQMQRLTINNLLRESDTVQKCRHGFELEGHEERLCVEFVEVFRRGYHESFLAGANDIASCLIEGTNATKGRFLAWWNDVAKLEDVVSWCLVACGAQRCILGGNNLSAQIDASFACYFEQRIAFNMKKTAPMINCHSIGELQMSDINTLVNYFRKRIPCKCLDKRYKEVKSVIKMGRCCNPTCSLLDRQVERKKMFCCMGCSDTYYCSPECQKAHWKSDHKKICKQLQI